MASNAIASTASVLAFMILSLTIAPHWFLVFLILLGMIKKRRTLPVSAWATWGDPQAPAGGALPPVGPPSPSGASPPAGGGVPLAGAPPLGGALPPTGDASASAADAPALAGKPESSSTSSSSSGIEWEVFMSFRGTDTRKTIADHLFSRLVGVGVSVSKDDNELHVGEETSQDIKEAISRSKISIPIFSDDYASSRSCLSELAQMWECRKIKGQTIIPIFYDVSPSDVRDQSGDFGRAFDLHKTTGVNSDTSRKWREVLREVGKLCGYSGNLYKGYESQLIEEVVLHVVRMLRDDALAVTDKLVGIDPHVQGIMRKLGVAHGGGRETEVHGEDVRVIGICGVPGAGKTTLAKVIYNEVHKLFEAYSFLEGISSKGVRFSQQMLFADLLNLEPAPLKSVSEGIEETASLLGKRKVLIVLDDVDEDEQIKALTGKLTWLGQGSRIILTTKNRKVLSAFDIGADGRGTVEEHEIEPMSDDHALQLFRNYAFQGDAPEEVSDSEYHFLSKNIVKAIGGVPRDIVHLASYLGRNMGIDSWRSTLELLQELRRTGKLL